MSRLAQMQARFQQKQMAEKEERLLKLYENQQQRAFEKVGRGSAGSNGTYTSTTSTTYQAGKVRQMFDERRQKAGIDRSYPLEPLKTSNAARVNSLDRTKPLRNDTSRTTIKTTVQKSISQVRNGKPLVSKREVIQGIYNNNGGEETYEERRYQDDNDSYNPERDLVSMLNKHNLNDNLDDEELPNFGIDEYEEPSFVGKLPNVGGSVRAQSDVNSNKSVTTNGTVRKEVKPHVRKSTNTSLSKTTPSNVLNKRLSNTVSPKSTASPPTSPRKSPSQTTTTTRSAPNKTKSPATSKPSVKSSTAPSRQVGTPRDDLVPCNFCERRFAEDRLKVHENICSKTAKKKRKQYDAVKHRFEGTDLEPYIRKAKVSTTSTKTSSIKKKPATDKKSDWRRKHEEFIAAIRAAKMAQAHIAKGGKISDLPPPPPSSNPDYVQCPHCGRKFNESAAERHIPKCATFLHNKPKNPPPKRR